jgi:peroxiredoxin
MRCLIIAALGLFLPASQVALGTDRAAEFDKLVHEYDAAAKEFRKIPSTNDSTSAEKIHRYEVWPGLRYLPRFLELAEAKPDDEAAYRCCQWLIARASNAGNVDKRIFPADQKAWEILAAYHTGRPELPMLCLQAADRCGPAQEQFLRGLLKRKDLSRENMGFATAALAELLAQKFEMIETCKPCSGHDEWDAFYWAHRAPDWGKDLIPANAPQFKAESIRLFRDVLERYADVPVTISANKFEGLKNLGEKAATSLHAWDLVTIGSLAPNIVGRDLEGKLLELSRYRGRVVVVSFWFTGCPGCMHELPEHQRLLKDYKGRPFTLLSVCTDASLAQARKTVASKGMNWPCWFDGEDGPIVRDWNVLASPTTYVLDQRGVIVAKNLRGERLARKIEDLMQEAK